MALETDVRPQCERLVLAILVAQHPNRAGRNAEGLVMPLKGREALHVAEPRHSVSIPHHVDRVPAHFPALVVCDLAPQGLGDKLAAEAVPQQRHVVIHRVPDQREQRRNPQ